MAASAPAVRPPAPAVRPPATAVLRHRPVDPPLFVTHQGAARPGPPRDRSDGRRCLADSQQSQCHQSAAADCSLSVPKSFRSPCKLGPPRGLTWVSKPVPATRRLDWSPASAERLGLDSDGNQRGTVSILWCVLCPWTCPHHSPPQPGGQRRCPRCPRGVRGGAPGGFVHLVAPFAWPEA